MVDNLVGLEMKQQSPRKKKKKELFVKTLLTSELPCTFQMLSSNENDLDRFVRNSQEVIIRFDDFFQLSESRGTPHLTDLNKHKNGFTSISQTLINNLFSPELQMQQHSVEEHNRNFTQSANYKSFKCQQIAEVLSLFSVLAKYLMMHLEMILIKLFLW